VEEEKLLKVIPIMRITENLYKMILIYRTKIIELVLNNSAINSQKEIL